MDLLDIQTNKELVIKSNVFLSFFTMLWLVQQMYIKYIFFSRNFLKIN